MNKSKNNKCIFLDEKVLTSKEFLALSSSAKVVYFYMKIYAKNENEFEYPISLALNFMSNVTFISARNELVKNGFIEIVHNGSANRTKNIYKFVPNWENNI